MGINQLNFKENLPKKCPPSDSVDAELKDVWRFIKGTVASESCFCSFAKLNRENKSNVCPCRWASCSLYIGDRNTLEMMKLPKFKNFKARVEMNIPLGSGRSKTVDRHIDFWAYDSFSFLGAVTRVELKK